MNATDLLSDLIDRNTQEVIHGILGTTRALRVSARQVERMPDHAVVRVMRGAESEMARLQAMQVRCMATLERRRRNPRSTRAEVALALCLTEKHAGKVVDAAQALTTRLPRTLELMERGQLDLYRARKVVEATAWLSDEKAREVDEVLASRLPGKNAVQVRRAAAYAALKADPEGGARRAEQKLRERRLKLHHREAGIADLVLEKAPVEKAAAAYARIDRAARALKTRDDPRTLDQLRADVAVDLLLGGHHGGPPRAEVFLYLDMNTFLRLNDNPAELAGHGPVPAEVARRIVAGPDTVLRRILTDPATGQVLDLGRTRYRPTAALDEFVRVRDRECRQPGCCRPAQAGELDHAVPWQHGGPTSSRSLAAYCGNHHHLKDEPGWVYQLDDDGTLTIRTPADHLYFSEPPSLHEPREEEPPDDEG
ncbi:DUF222 domain-containing protein [Amycolatopsis sp. NPDC059021]|uniref:HNH endonuclease signature motif containing protein n=1 Tax=Amycolatopsis sp. NPDC059021 TaxID=3346704 RepID=UPI00366C8A69